MLNTKLLVTSIGVPQSNVHNNILMVLADAFEGSTFLEFVPELVAISYLGPDPTASALVETEATDEEAGKTSSTVLVVVFSVVCVVLLLQLIMCAAFPSKGKALFDRVASFCKRKNQNPSRTDEGVCREPLALRERPRQRFLDSWSSKNDYSQQ